MNTESREIVAKALESGEWNKQAGSFGARGSYKCGCVMGVAMATLGYNNRGEDRIWMFETEQKIWAVGRYIQGSWTEGLPERIRMHVKRHQTMVSLNDETDLTFAELAQIFRVVEFVSSV